MIVISSALVLSGSDDLQPNNPVIGWDNRVTINNITSSTEAEGFPITNVANPITSPAGRWKGTGITGDEEILVELEGVFCSRLRQFPERMFQLSQAFYFDFSSRSHWSVLALAVISMPCLRPISFTAVIRYVLPL